MKNFSSRLALWVGLGVGVVACSPHPYATTNKSYKQQAKAYAKTLRTVPPVMPGEDSLPHGDYWVGTTNFNMRKPNYVVIHHTAQDSTAQTLKTFTLPKTQVSAHYVIGDDGKVYHMLHDYLRAWHGGIGKWGNNTDLNSSSIGIELDNNGNEPFSEAQIASLVQLLGLLKKNYGIPTANFIGHSDIAPGRKIDPNPLFPWKRLAEAGFGLWYDEAEVQRLILEENIVQDTIPLLTRVGLQLVESRVNIAPAPSGLPADTTVQDTVPASFNPRVALRIIGYDTKDLNAAIRAFQLHFIQDHITGTLTEQDRKILYSLYRKLL